MKKYAIECIGCGACEDACPQHISIRKELADVAKLFEQKPSEETGETEQG